MKKFIDWILKNVSILFNFFGIVLTLYFGVFYVPSWIREIQNEKLNNSQKNLEQSVKELIYSDSLCTIGEIKVLYEAKEIEFNNQYPYSLKEILTKTQDSFMQDKFLPLDKRKKFINQIETLKSKITSETSKAEAKKSVPFSFLELFSIIFSISGVLVAVVSFYIKFRMDKEKQEELENSEIIEDKNKLGLESGIVYADNIIDSIKSFPGIELIKDWDEKFDLQFSYKGQNYFVEFKYLLRSKVGLRSIYKFLPYVKGLDGEFWLIYNTDLTEMAKRKVKEINQSVPSKQIIRLIKIEFSENAYNIITELLT